MISLFKRYFFTLPFFIIVIGFYVWFISAGTWTDWNSPTRYYANLARGFSNGNLYVASKVPAELQTLPDPYDYKARAQAGIKVPIDISYYNGKFYLYWGPVPALLLWLFSPLYQGRVGDMQIVFVSLSGIFLMQYLFLLMVWRNFFNQLPIWILYISILVVGLVHPIPFMLDYHSGARIYEAAITAAQFFLLGGFLFAFTAWRTGLRVENLFLAGVFWVLAIGSRQTIALL